jgi:hypothetical protein
MRTLLTILQHTGPSLVLPAGAVLLLVTGGCGLTPNEDEGDPEPFLAEYRVGISRKDVTLFTGDEQDVILSVSCVPANASPDCANNNPDWSMSNPGFWFLSAKVVDRTKPTTVITLKCIGEPAATSHGLGRNSLVGAQSRFLIAFFPRHVPETLRLTGQRWVVATIPLDVYGLDFDSRQVDAPEKAVLSVFPKPLIIRPRDTGATNEVLLISYKGSATDLQSVVLTTTNPEKFSLLRPILPLAMGTRFMVSLPVTFLGLNDSNDNNIYNAEVTVTTADGATGKVSIQAYR